MKKRTLSLFAVMGLLISSSTFANFYQENYFKTTTDAELNQQIQAELAANKKDEENQISWFYAGLYGGVSYQAYPSTSQETEINGFAFSRIYYTANKWRPYFEAKSYRSRETGGLAVFSSPKGCQC